MPKLKSYTKEWLEELCQNSCSYAEVLKKAGRKQGGGTQATLRKKIAEFNIDISHFTGQAWSKGKTAQEDPRIFNGGFKIPDDIIFVENSKISRSVVRNRILKQNLIPYKCDICGNTGEWLGKSLTLQLDHINGINNDHRLENLRWLCPNCHSQTENFAGRNSQAGQTISNEIIEQNLQINETAAQLLQRLGLSVNGINLYKVKSIAYKNGFLDY